MIVETYRQGIKISGILGHGNKNPVKRGVVTDCSKASRKRLDWPYLQGPWRSMLTLTFHDNYEKKSFDLEIFRKILNSWLQTLRDRKVNYLWVKEVQFRGVLHLHVCMDREFDDIPSWEDLEGKNSWRPLMRSWLRLTNQDGDIEAVKFAMHKTTYTKWSPDIKFNYFKKYFSKSDQKGLPVGIKSFGRWWGCSRGLKLVLDTLIVGGDNNEYLYGREKNNWFQFRRQVKKLIEKKSGFRFLKDRIGSRLSIKMSMKKDLVFCVERLRNYYIDGGSVDLEKTKEVPF